MRSTLCRTALSAFGSVLLALTLFATAAVNPLPDKNGRVDIADGCRPLTCTP